MQEEHLQRPRRGHARPPRRPSGKSHEGVEPISSVAPPKEGVSSAGLQIETSFHYLHWLIRAVAVAAATAAPLSALFRCFVFLVPFFPGPLTLLLHLLLHGWLGRLHSSDNILEPRWQLINVVPTSAQHPKGGAYETEAIVAWLDLRRS